MTDEDVKEMTEEEWYYQFGDCVAATLNVCAAKRWVAGGGECEEGELIPPTDRAADIADAASTRLHARDLGPVHEVLASQALALDEIFTQFAGMAAKNPEFFKTSMAIALKAQAQCRWTLKALLAMNGPVQRAGMPATRPARAAQNLCEQTIENGNSTS